MSKKTKAERKAVKRASIARKAAIKSYVKVAIVAAVVAFITATYSKWIPVAKDLVQKAVEIVKVESE